MSEKKATVIVPTTGDRGPLLPYSVGSILNQTVKDIEIFIIGDGVDNQTRDTIYKLIEKDNRIRFFDHPKDVSRGEIYRHQALQEASGKIVCYLLDRDLMLPFHIANLLKYYEKYNFVSSLTYRIFQNYANRKLRYRGEPNHRFWNAVDNFSHVNNLEFDERTVDFNLKSGKKLTVGPGYKLSCISHTLEIYNKLPHGWRTTPIYYYTDSFMHLQLYSHAEIKPYLGISPPSILYFRRGNFPGIPIEDRVKELEYWYSLIHTNNYLPKVYKLLLKGKIKDIRSDARKVRKRFYSFFRKFSNSAWEYN